MVFETAQRKTQEASEKFFETLRWANETASAQHHLRQKDLSKVAHDALPKALLTESEDTLIRDLSTQYQLGNDAHAQKIMRLFIRHALDNEDDDARLHELYAQYKELLADHLGDTTRAEEIARATGFRVLEKSFTQRTHAAEIASLQATIDAQQEETAPQQQSETEPPSQEPPTPTPNTTEEPQTSTVVDTETPPVGTSSEEPVTKNPSPFSPLNISRNLEAVRENDARVHAEKSEKETALETHTETTLPLGKTVDDMYFVTREDFDALARKVLQEQGEYNDTYWKVVDDIWNKRQWRPLVKGGVEVNRQHKLARWMQEAYVTYKEPRLSAKGTERLQEMLTEHPLLRGVEREGIVLRFTNQVVALRHQSETVTPQQVTQIKVIQEQLLPYLQRMGMDETEASKVAKKITDLGIFDQAYSKKRRTHTGIRREETPEENWSHEHITNETLVKGVKNMRYASLLDYFRKSTGNPNAQLPDKVTFDRMTRKWNRWTRATVYTLMAAAPTVGAVSGAALGAALTGGTSLWLHGIFGLAGLASGVISARTIDKTADKIFGGTGKTGSALRDMQLVAGLKEIEKRTETGLYIPPRKYTTLSSTLRWMAGNPPEPARGRDILKMADIRAAMRRGERSEELNQKMGRIVATLLAAGVIIPPHLDALQAALPEWPAWDTASTPSPEPITASSNPTVGTILQHWLSNFTDIHIDPQELSSVYDPDCLRVYPNGSFYFNPTGLAQ